MREGKKGRGGKVKEISPLRSFLKVGAYEIFIETSK